MTGDLVSASFSWLLYMSMKFSGDDLRGMDVHSALEQTSRLSVLLVVLLTILSFQESSVQP